MEPLADRWRAFGWGVAEVDGHDPKRCWQPLRRPGRPDGHLPHRHTHRARRFLHARQHPWHHGVPTTSSWPWPG